MKQKLTDVAKMQIIGLRYVMEIFRNWFDGFKVADWSVAKANETYQFNVNSRKLVAVDDNV